MAISAIKLDQNGLKGKVGLEHNKTWCLAAASYNRLWLTQLFQLRLKERYHTKFLEGHLNELGVLIGPNKSGSSVDKAA